MKLLLLSLLLHLSFKTSLDTIGIFYSSSSFTCYFSLKHLITIVFLYSNTKITYKQIALLTVIFSGITYLTEIFNAEGEEIVKKLPTIEDKEPKGENHEIGTTNIYNDQYSM